MEKGSVEERVLAILHDLVFVDVDETREKLEKKDLDINEDLGADSLDAVEIILEIEEEFGIHIEDDEAEKNTSFRSIVALTKGKLEEIQDLKNLKA